MAARPSNGHTTHVRDGRVDTLSAIVEGQGKLLVALDKKVDGVSDSLGSMIKGVSDKMDAQQQTAYTLQRQAIDANKNNWVAIVVALATVAGVFISTFVVIGSMALSPIRETVGDLKRDSREQSETTVKTVDFNDFKDAQQRRNIVAETGIKDANAAISALAVSVAHMQGQSEEQRASYLRELADTKASIRDIDGALVKRPEIEAANRSQDQRTDALSARANAMQAQIDALFPPSKLIDELWSGLREVRALAGAVLVPAPPKAAPAD